VTGTCAVTSALPARTAGSVNIGTFSIALVFIVWSVVIVSIVFVVVVIIIIIVLIVVIVIPGAV
jgi:hypothetical protein